MNLQEVFDQLSSGEFSQISIGGAEAGVLDETNYGKVLGHINLGLTSLFKRFKLKEGRLVVPLVTDQTLYPLSAVDLLKVEQVLTDDDVELPLNDGSNGYSVFTPKTLQLRVPELLVNGSTDIPEELITENLTVVYRANHSKITLDMVLFVPAEVELELPDSYFEALLYFVASRVNNPIGMTNEFHAGNSYAAKYEMACQQMEVQGLQVDQGGTNTRLSRNGWA